MTEEMEEIREIEKGESTEEEPREEKDPLLAEGDSPDFKWYVAKTLTGQENKVSRSLRENIVNHRMVEQFSKILIPEETATTHVGGKKRTIKRKFFPGYVLIKMIMNDKTWHLVNDTDKITGLVGNSPMKPTPLSDEEASNMIGQSIHGKRKSKAIIDLQEGDQVKVVDGPFASFVGTVETVNEKGRVRVNVSIFGRPTPVDLELSQIEKVA